MNYDLENIEGTSQPSEGTGKDRLSDVQCSYIIEALETDDSTFLADRIDEITGDIPPKAIDSNPEINALLGDKEGIDKTLLEAPNDIEQAREASEMLRNIEGADFKTWQSLSIEERADVLQEIESNIAEIAHRPDASVELRSLGRDASYGYYDNNGHIVINQDFIDASYENYRECLDTIVHEGRHAYQDYNLNVRQVHPSAGDITNWRINEFNLSYQDYKTYGMERYWMQPLEADARKFAEDVVTRFLG